MQQKISLDNLTTNSVSVKMQNFILHETAEYDIGLPHRTAYINSTRGRAELTDELPEPYRSAVLAVWGPEPTITEETEERTL